MPHRLSTADADFEARFSALLQDKRESAVDVQDTVAAIMKVSAARILCTGMRLGLWVFANNCRSDRTRPP